MPSPVPRRDQSNLIARFSTSSGLPQRSGRSAPTLRVSRLARRSLTLWPASLLTPLRSRFLECFSPSRYLLEPPQVLPVERELPDGFQNPLESTRLSTAHRPPRATRPPDNDCLTTRESLLVTVLEPFHLEMVHLGSAFFSSATPASVVLVWLR